VVSSRSARYSALSSALKKEWAGRIAGRRIIDRCESTIDHALAELSLNPIQELTLSDLADGQKSSVSTIYRYFNGIDEVEWVARVIDMEAVARADVVLLSEYLAAVSSREETAAALTEWSRNGDHPRALRARLNLYRSLAYVTTRARDTEILAETFRRCVSDLAVIHRKLHAQSLISDAVDPHSVAAFMFTRFGSRVLSDLVPQLVADGAWTELLGQFHSNWCLHEEPTLLFDATYAPPAEQGDFSRIEFDIDRSVAYVLPTALPEAGPEAATICAGAVRLVLQSPTSTFTVQDLMDSMKISTNSIYSAFEDLETLKRLALVSACYGILDAQITKLSRVSALTDQSEIEAFVGDWIRDYLCSPLRQERQVVLVALASIIQETNLDFQSVFVDLTDRLRSVFFNLQASSYLSNSFDPQVLATFLLGNFSVESIITISPTLAPSPCWEQMISLSFGELILRQDSSRHSQQVPHADGDAASR
jgi:AcrR family transcriptional regulator